MNIWEYSNPLWEPHFANISPFLSKVYFMTNFGPLRYFAASLIFKKLSRMEGKHDRNP